MLASSRRPKQELFIDFLLKTLRQMEMRTVNLGKACISCLLPSYLPTYYPCYSSLSKSVLGLQTNMARIPFARPEFEGGLG
jgi:hypothetical protein